MWIAGALVALARGHHTMMEGRPLLRLLMFKFYSMMKITDRLLRMDKYGSRYRPTYRASEIKTNHEPSECILQCKMHFRT